jgi:hypothetical protein
VQPSLGSKCTKVRKVRLSCHDWRPLFGKLSRFKVDLASLDRTKAALEKLA